MKRDCYPMEITHLHWVKGIENCNNYLILSHSYQESTYIHDLADIYWVRYCQAQNRSGGQHEKGGLGCLGLTVWRDGEWNEEAQRSTALTMIPCITSPWACESVRDLHSSESKGSLFSSASYFQFSCCLLIFFCKAAIIFYGISASVVMSVTHTCTQIFEDFILKVENLRTYGACFDSQIPLLSEDRRICSVFSREYLWWKEITYNWTSQKVINSTDVCQPMLGPPRLQCPQMKVHVFWKKRLKPSTQ